MSKHLSDEIAKSIDKEELDAFYHSHMPQDTMKEFNIPSHHILNTVLDILGIKRMTSSEISSMQYNQMSDDEKNARANKIGASHLGQKRSDDARQNMCIAQQKVDHSHLLDAGKDTRFKNGNKPWNYGKSGAQHWIGGQYERKMQTMRNNNSFNISNQEEDFYAKLCDKYGEDNVIRQYTDKQRYPFACDFYIPSEDLFIEFNRTWTHGGHPFDPMSLEDISKLEMWEEKAKSSKYYKNAIYTWTNLDVRKQKIAKDNNLNYLTIY